MAQFKQVPQVFLTRKMAEFWGNMTQNLDEDVEDRDFFNVPEALLSHKQVLSFVHIAYTDEELKLMSESESRYRRVNLNDDVDDLLATLWNNAESRKKCRLLMKAIRKQIFYTYKKPRKAELIELRFRDLQKSLGLTDLELEVLTFAYLKSETCLEYPRRLGTQERPVYFAMALDRSYCEVMEAMSPKGKLRKYNILDDDWDFNARAYGGYLGGTEKDALERRFYKKSETETLPWEYYGELSKTHGKLLKLLIGSRKDRINILLYGAPGTGKTSFARSLASEMGLEAYEVRQGDSDGKNISSASRLAGIQICNEQVNPDKSLMIIDEADELLRSSSGMFASLFGFGGGKTTEKGVVNSILDDMRVPAVWIANTAASAIDEAVRRRFDYSIEFESLNTMQREMIWKNGVEKHGLGKLICDEDIPELAAKYSASAGGISMVLEHIKDIRPKSNAVKGLVESLMKPHCELMGIQDAGTRTLPAKDYSLDGLNIKSPVKLERIVDAVRNFGDAEYNSQSRDIPRMNLLLWGPPGTGKTEFVKYLGKVLGKKVLVRMGSDILDKFVGGTEENIRRAFKQAEAEHAVLFLDEIDGLVQNRSSAHHSWEVTQVNELLYQMENFNGVMIGATNHSDGLDPAIMRRFTFKVEFDYLENEGKAMFFERMLDRKLSSADRRELDEIPNLAPGDFRTVRQSLFYCGTQSTNSEYLAALAAETAAKRIGARSRIGF